MSMVFLSVSYVAEFYVVFKHFQNLENNSTVNGTVQTATISKATIKF